MKPLKLQLQAFGPFAGLESVDFSSLGQRPLFLINGPTGAGKSTLLDALCYALYGETTGKERRGEQMRCDRAQAATETWVALEFQLGKKRYRIERKPTQQLPKRKGEGTTTRQASALFYQLDTETTPLHLISNRITEVNASVKALLGLNADQFRQVMVLPQGRFRALLLAPSGEREAILGQLFQTQIYARIESLLTDKARLIEQQRRDLDQQIKGVLQTSGLASEAAIHDQLQDLAPRLEETRNRHTQNQLHLQTADRAWQAGLHLQERFVQLHRVQEQQAETERLRPQKEQQKKQLFRAQRAAQIRPYYQQLGHLQKQQQEQQQQLQATAALLQKNRRQAEVAKTQLLAAQEAFASTEALQAELHQLKSLRAPLAKRAQARQAWQEAQEQAEKLNTQQSTLSQQKEQRVQRLQKQDAQMRALREALDQKQDVQSEVLKAEQAFKAAEYWQQLETAKKQLEADGLPVAQRLQEQRDAYRQQLRNCQSLEKSWHLSQAALLAQALETAAPCPVCGSCEHPSPAPATAQMVSKEEVQQARETLESINQAGQNLSAEQTRLKTQLDEKKEQQEALLQSAGALVRQPLHQLQEVLTKARQQVQETQALQQQIMALDREIQQLEKNQEALRLESQALEDKRQAAQAQAFKLAAQLEQLEQQLPEPLQDPEQLEKKIASQQKQLDQLKYHLNAGEQQERAAAEAVAQQASRLQEQQDQQSRLNTALQEAHQQWQQALKASHFNQTGDWQAACLSPAEEARLQDDLDSYQKRQAQFQGQRVAMESDLKDQKPPCLESLEAAYQDALGLYQQSEQQQAELREATERLHRVLDELEHLHQKNQQLETDYQLFGTLAASARGQNTQRISLQRFVLGVLLDEVLTLASRHLRLMSRGRFTLVRADRRAAHGGASGLDLDVSDDYSGQRREVATLSGGESFMAALALALGLSERVQAASGGIRLDALFIDEGFGSLDAETLELAIQLLTQLQDQGRMIGIISHVAELQQQLALRIQVQSGPQGSYLKIKAAT